MSDFPVGSTVRHLGDGDIGTVLEHRAVTPRQPEHYVILWQGEHGPHAQSPDELALVALPSR